MTIWAHSSPRQSRKGIALEAAPGGGASTSRDRTMRLRKKPDQKLFPAPLDPPERGAELHSRSNTSFV